MGYYDEVHVHAQCTCQCMRAEDKLGEIPSKYSSSQIGGLFEAAPPLVKMPLSW